MVDVVPPLRDETLIDADGRPTLRFSEYLENVAIDVNTVTSEDIQIVSSAAELSIQNALITRLADRLEDLENTKDNEVFNSRIAAINARVTQLIDDLIDEIKKLGNTDLANKSLALQEKTFAELELLNTRAEEAWYTGINMEDTQ